MGYIFAIIGAILAAINNTLRKQTATNHDANLILIYQYFWIGVCALGAGIIYASYMGGTFFPLLTTIQRIGIGSIAVIGYLGIMFFVYALQKEPAAIVSLVANVSVFMMFAANRYLFPLEESVSLMRIAISLIFFGIVAMFMLDTQSTHHTLPKSNIINTNLIYPILTALCRTYFFVGNNYIIQYKLLDPIQTVCVTEIGVGICAVIYYLMQGGKLGALKQHFSLGSSPAMMMLGLTGVLSAIAFYFGYQQISANIVNVIRLSMIMFTALFSRRWLGDKLTHKQIWLLCAGIVSLVLFVLIP